MICDKCKIEKCEKCNEEIQPTNYKFPIQLQGCLHDNCPGCRAGTCNGVHMISCPCPKCSPQWM